MAQIDDLQSLRNYFGLSQEFLASYFSVGRSILNMAERGERTLPVTAVMKFADLLQFSNSEEPKPPTEPTAANAATIQNGNKELLDQATDCSLMAYKLQKELAAAKQYYAQGTHALALAQYLATKPVDAKTKNKMKLWLQVLQNDAEKKINRYGPAAQALLQWKLDWYAYGEKRAKELAGM